MYQVLFPDISLPPSMGAETLGRDLKVGNGIWTKGIGNWHAFDDRFQLDCMTKRVYWPEVIGFGVPFCITCVMNQICLPKAYLRI